MTRTVTKILFSKNFDSYRNYWRKFLSFCTISKHIVQKVKDPILQLEPYLILSHDNQQLYCHKAKISRSESW